MARVCRGRLRSAVVVAYLLGLPAGCGVSDGLDRFRETIDETFDNSDQASTPASGVVTGRTEVDDWVTYVSESGSFAVDLPAEPEYVDSEEEDDSTVGAWAVEAESNRYGVVERRLKPGKSYDFEMGVASAVEDSVGLIAERVDGPVTSTVTDQKLEVLDGHLGVRFIASIDVADDAYATLHGALFETDETLVLVTMIDLDGDSADRARRFLDSVDFSP